MNCVSINQHNRKSRLSPGLAVLIVALFTTVPALPAQTVADTISRAFADMESENSELRRGAVMLLGKYSLQPGVLDTLCEALEDPDTRVRRAAAVSVVEHIGKLTTDQARQLLGALQDPDKEVRLTVATWLPQVILRAMRRTPANQNALILGNELALIRDPIISALSDDEPLIRRSAVQGLQYLMAPIAAQQLVHLFADPDAQVRLAAYPVLRRLLPAATFAKAALDQFPDPDPAARLALTEAAATQPSPGMKPLLERLIEDTDPTIHLLAGTGLFLIAPTDGLPQSLRTALESDSLEPTLVLRIINAIRGVDPVSRKTVVDLLLQSKRPSIRGQAVGLRLQGLTAPPPPGTFEDYLADPAPEIRQQALRIMATRPQLVDPGLVMGLPDNPYLDVRQRTLSLMRHLDETQQAQTLLRLLLDTEPNIRASTLSRIAQVKPANWQGIFRASLRDPSPRVQQTAASILVRALGPEGTELAQSYSREFPDREISRYIQQELTRLTN